MEEKIYFDWSNLEVNWIDVEYIWIDVAITRKVEQAFGGNPFGGVPGTKHVYLPPAEVVKKALDKKEYKRFITLVCKVNGITVQSMKERKPECKLTLTEIKRTIEEVLRPQVRVTHIHKNI
jgi:hypothetical protein